MTQLPSQQGPIVELRPQPNVYTVLLLIAVIALAIAVGVVFWKLTSPLPVGYGLEVKELLDPIR